MKELLGGTAAEFMYNNILVITACREAKGIIFFKRIAEGNICIFSNDLSDCKRVHVIFEEE